MKKCIKRIEVRYGYIEIDLTDSASQMDAFSRVSDMVADKLKIGNLGEMEDRRLLAGKFEDIFGIGSCQKTFGTDTPDILQLEEFWNKFSRLLQGWLKKKGG